MGNVDWKYFGIDSPLQRRILAPLAKVLKAGYGSVEIVIHQHKVAEIKHEIKERMTEETTPSLTQDGVDKR